MFSFSAKHEDERDSQHKTGMLTHEEHKCCKIWREKNITMHPTIEDSLTEKVGTQIYKTSIRVFQDPA